MDILFLSLRKTSYLKRGMYASNTSLCSSPAPRVHVAMTQNATACLEECCFLSWNSASDRALAFAEVLGFLSVLTDALVSPTNI